VLVYLNVQESLSKVFSSVAVKVQIASSLPSSTVNPKVPVIVLVCPAFIFWGGEGCNT